MPLWKRLRVEQARSFPYLNFSRRLKLQTVSVRNVSPTAKSFLDCQRTKRNATVVSQHEFPRYDTVADGAGG